MTLGELIKQLFDIDYLPAEATKVFDTPVVFDTSTRFDLHLLSVYYAEEDKKIHIDIGKENE